MKKFLVLFFLSLIVVGTGSVLVSFAQRDAHCPVPVLPMNANSEKLAALTEIKGCVFKTIYEGEGLDPAFILATPQPVLKSEERGLKWLVNAQATNGGFGSGTHARQDIIDPHAVSADPATTAMVGMALLRLGNGLEQGVYAQQLKKATEYILLQVEGSPKGSLNITTLQGTQIQSKLGANIDVALAAQFLTNLSTKLGENHR